MFFILFIVIEQYKHDHMTFRNNIGHTKLTDFNMMSCKLNYRNKIKCNQRYNPLNIEYTLYLKL